MQKKKNPKTFSGRWPGMIVPPLPRFNISVEFYHPLFITTKQTFTGHRSKPFVFPQKNNLVKGGRFSAGRLTPEIEQLKTN